MCSHGVNYYKMETKAPCILIWIVVAISMVSATQVAKLQDCETTGFPEVTLDIDDAVYETKTQISGWRQNISVVVEGGFVNSLIKLTCGKCPHVEDAGIEYVMEESLLETILPNGWVRRPAGQPIRMEWFMLPTMRTDRTFLVRCRYIHNASLGVTITTRFTGSREFNVKIGTDDNAAGKLSIFEAEITESRTGGLVLSSTFIFNDDVKCKFQPNYQPEDECEAKFYHQVVPVGSTTELGFRSYKLLCEMPLECLEPRGSISIRLKMEEINKGHVMLDTKLGGKVCWSQWENTRNMTSKNSLLVTDLSPKVLACSDPDGALQKPLMIGTFVIFGIPDITARIPPIYFSDEDIDPLTMFSEPQFEMTSVVVGTHSLEVNCTFSKYFCNSDKSNLITIDGDSNENEFITAYSVVYMEHLHVFQKTWLIQIQHTLRSLRCKCFPQTGKWKPEQLPIQQVNVAILEPMNATLQRIGTELRNFSIGMITQSLECKARGRPRPIPDWYKLPGKDADADEIKMSKVEFRSGSDRNKAGVTWAELIFDRITYDTRGRYECRVGDTEKIAYEVMVTGPPEIYFSKEETESGRIYFVQPGEKTFNLTCSVRGDPNPSIYWRRNVRLSRSASKQSNGTTSATETKNGIFYKENVLSLHNISSSDDGNYSCIAKNSIGNATEVFRLVVASPPKIVIKGNTNIKAFKTRTIVQVRRHSNHAQIVECHAAGWPRANVSWEGISGLLNDTLLINETLVVSQLRFSSVPYGSVSKAVCVATNHLGIATETLKITIVGPPEFTPATDTDKVCDMGTGNSCKISAWVNGQPQPRVEWTFKGQTVADVSKAQLDTEIELEKVLSSVSYDDAGIYICNATNDFESVLKHIKVTVRGKPEIISTVSRAQLDKSATNPKIKCTARGFPNVDIKWQYKGMFTSLESRVEREERSGVFFVTSFLQVPVVTKRTEGKYKCIASNSMGNVTHTIKVQVTDEAWRLQQIGLGVGIPLLIIFFIFVGVLLRYKLWKQRILIQKLTEADIQKFFHGDPNARKDDFFDAEAKGYDEKFEIPRETIVFEDGTDGHNVLGVGNFGVVKKGTLKGPSTEIAVKTIKSHADAIHFKSLMTEIKVLGYLEGHPNIVSLVGAVTSNLKNRELYAAFEYCQHADLLSFMKKNQRGFKNLLTKSGYKRLDNSLEICRVDHVGGTGSFRGSSSRLKDRVETFNTSDLYGWARDVAFGMIYLTIKKVIHGDLAARNILLTATRVAKISDFGLSHQLVKDNSIYAQKDANALIPWRWLPPETIGTLEFSPQTDVWSYGVLLWEIFSLGDTPYAGFEYNSEFLRHLAEGYRLQKPGFADSRSYDIMNECWAGDRTKRPDFQTIFEHYQYNIQDNLLSTLDSETGLTEIEESEM